MFELDSTVNISQAMAKEFVEKQEAALKKWLRVESVEEAIERIEDLRCQGKQVEITADPLVWKSVGDPLDFKYSATQTVRFKIINLKEK